MYEPTSYRLSRLAQPEDRQVVARDDLSDDGDGNADAIRLFAEAVETLSRHRAENFVIVAAGHEPVEQVRPKASRPCGPPRESGTWSSSTTADLPLARIILARSPARPSDTSIAALAWSPQGDSRADGGAADGDSGRRDALARQVTARRPIRRFPQRRGPRAASPMVPVTQIQIADLGRGAPDHAARRNLAERGDREGQRSRRLAPYRRRGADRRNPGSRSEAGGESRRATPRSSRAGKARFEQKPARIGALGGKVRDIHAERFSRDRGGSVAREGSGPIPPGQSTVSTRSCRASATGRPHRP